MEHVKYEDVQQNQLPNQRLLWSANKRSDQSHEVKKKTEKFINYFFILMFVFFFPPLTNLVLQFFKFCNYSQRNGRKQQKFTPN